MINAAPENGDPPFAIINSMKYFEGERIESTNKTGKKFKLASVREDGIVVKLLEAGGLFFLPLSGS
jgi:hypothetical protein